MHRIKDVIVTESQLNQAEKALEELVSAKEGPFWGAFSRELANSIGECKAYRKTGLAITIGDNEISGDLEALATEMQFAKNTLLHFISKPSVPTREKDMPQETSLGRILNAQGCTGLSGIISKICESCAHQSSCNSGMNKCRAITILMLMIAKVSAKTEMGLADIHSFFDILKESTIE